MRNTLIIKLFFSLILLIFFLLSCTAKLSQEEAEHIATQFLNARIKFYVNGNATGQRIVETYTVESVEGTPDGNDWYVYFHITKDGKKNDIAMKVSSSSKKVVELNGKPVGI